MYFQAIDDKTSCVGVYCDGHLIFDEPEMPKSFKNSKTWKHSGSITDDSVKYGWIVSGGKNLHEACPDYLKEKFTKQQKKMLAFKKSFDIAKIDFRQHCFFDLVPHDFLKEFLEIKNQITQHVFENNETPKTYEHLAAVEKLLYKIRYRELKVNVKDCRGLMANFNFRSAANKTLNNSKYIDYNLFGTVTGRLSTYPGSFPILTMGKELRMLVKPQNDWFLALDYNGAEVRTLLSLLGEEQPEHDIHDWNAKNIFDTRLDRDVAKKRFFAWLYNPRSDDIKSDLYDREKILELYWDNNTLVTPYDRELTVDRDRALNYCLQSTCADTISDRMNKIHAFLQDKKSKIAFSVHDEVVIDVTDDEKKYIPEIIELFSNNKLGKFSATVKAGRDFGNLKRLNL